MSGLGRGLGTPVTLGRWVWTPLAVMGGSGLKGREELGHRAEAPVFLPCPGFPVYATSCFLGKALGTRGHLGLASCSPSSRNPMLGSLTRTLCPAQVPSPDSSCPLTPHSQWLITVCRTC